MTIPLALSLGLLLASCSSPDPTLDDSQPQHPEVKPVKIAWKDAVALIRAKRLKAVAERWGGLVVIHTTEGTAYETMQPAGAVSLRRLLRELYPGGGGPTYFIQ